MNSVHKILIVWAIFVMGSKAHVASLKQKEARLKSHEKTLQNCLDIIKDQQRKFEIENLQLESMLDALNTDLNESSSTPNLDKFPLLTEEPEKAINEQELQLGVSALDQMLAGSFYSKENEEEEEEEEEDDDDDDDDDEDGKDDNEEMGRGNVASSSVNPRKRTKFDESVVGLHTDIFDFMDHLE